MKSSNYKTKQREAILTYIKEMKGEHVTVQQVVDHFRARGVQIGVTTIYRYLEKLHEEGIVRKYVLDGVSGACFEYSGEAGICHDHFHFKCEMCGGLVHFHCHAVEEIQRHLCAEHGFQVNARKTIFYGRCQRCREEK